jgi:hypothetical protein
MQEIVPYEKRPKEKSRAFLKFYKTYQSVTLSLPYMIVVPEVCCIFTIIYDSSRRSLVVISSHYHIW